MMPSASFSPLSLPLRPRTSILILLAFAAAGCEGPAPADRVLLEARIWTGDPHRPEATALAIAGDRVTAVGSDREIRRWVGPETRVERLGGLRVVPGFHDAHMHLPTRRTADLSGAGSPEGIVERLRAFAADLPSGAWLTGRGWTPDLFGDGVPDRAVLDAAFPDRPVWITDRDGHLGLANARALELAGVTRTTADPPGGAIDRRGDGSPPDSSGKAPPCAW